MRQTLTRQLRASRPLLNTRLSPLAKHAPVSKEESDSLRAVFNNIMSTPEDMNIPVQTDKSGLIFDSALHAVEMERRKKALISSKLINTSPRTVMGTGVTSGGGGATTLENLAQSFTNTSHTTTSGRTYSARMKEMSLALSNTLEYLQTGFESDYDLVKYIESKVLELDGKFVEQQKKLSKSAKTSEKRALAFSKSLVSNVQKQSALDPSQPIINEYTMPILLAESIKILSETYKSPDAALSLFHLTKQQSLKTYVYVCTIGVYNEVFRCHWKYYKSVSMVLELINEIKVNGIRGSTETVRILSEIIEDSHKMLLNDSNDGVEFSFSLKRGPEKWTQMWSKTDEDDLKAVEQYRQDLFSVVTQYTALI